MPEEPVSKHSLYSRYTVRNNMGTKRQEEPKKHWDASTHSRYLHFSGTGRKPPEPSENTHLCMHGRKDNSRSVDQTADNEFSSVSKLKHIFDEGSKESTKYKLDASKRKSASLPERFRTSAEQRPISDPIGAAKKAAAPPRLRNIAEGIAEKRAKFERGSSLESVCSSPPTAPLNKRRPHSVSLTDLVPELLEAEEDTKLAILNDAANTERQRTGSDPGKKTQANSKNNYRHRSGSLIASAERKLHPEHKPSTLASAQQPIQRGGRRLPSPPVPGNDVVPLLRTTSLDSALDEPIKVQKVSVTNECPGHHMFNGDGVHEKDARKRRKRAKIRTGSYDVTREDDKGEESDVDTDSETSSYSETSDDEEDNHMLLKLHQPVLNYEQPLRSALSKRTAPTSSKQKSCVGFREDPPPCGFTYSAEDYERGNTEIDPVTASAEWELEKRVDKMDIFSADLEKDEKGLGLSIIGLGVGTDTGVEKLGIFIKSLTPGGTAEKDGRIHVNDQILEVDGVSLVGVTQMFAAQTLKNTRGTVRFLMGREKGRLTHTLGAKPHEAEEHRHVDNDFAAHMSEKLEEFARRVQDAESRAKSAEDKAAEVEQRAVTAEQKLASLQQSNQQQVSKSESDHQAEKKKLEKLLADMTERARRAESDLACAEAENEDLTRQLEESKGLYMILEKKYHESKTQMKEHVEREASHMKELMKQKRQEIRILELEREVIQLRRENATMAPVNERNTVQTTAETTTGGSNTVDDNRLISSEPFTKSRESLSDGLEKIHRDEKTTEKDDKVRNEVQKHLTEAVPETQVLNNRYLKDKRRISPTKRKPTRSGGVLSSSSNEFTFGDEDEDEEESEDSDKEREERREIRPQQFALPGLMSAGDFKLRPASENPLKERTATESKSSPVLEVRSSFPFAGKDHQPDVVVVENLLIKQTSKEVSNEVESLPALLEQEGIHVKDDDDDDDDDNHDDDDDIHSSVSSSNGSTSFMPPAMPLLSVGARPPSAKFPSSTPDLLPQEEQTCSESGSTSEYPDTSKSILSSTSSQDPTDAEKGVHARANRPQSENSWKTLPVPSWDVRQVGLWLIGMELDQYKDEFENKGIDGKQLLNIDTSKLKTLGVNSNDRPIIKKRIKEMKAEIEREQKALKAREKESKAAAKKDSKVKTERKAFRKGKYIVTHT